MSKAVHTPGPWSVDMEMAKVYSEPTNLMVASISIPTNPACQEAWPADARLIAAAPTLLGTLRLTERNLTSLIDARNENAVLMTAWRDVVRDVIAMAAGEA